MCGIAGYVGVPVDVYERRWMDRLLDATRVRGNRPPVEIRGDNYGIAIARGVPVLERDGPSRIHETANGWLGVCNGTLAEPERFAEQWGLPEDFRIDTDCILELLAKAGSGEYSMEGVAKALSGEGKSFAAALVNPATGELILARNWRPLYVHTNGRFIAFASTRDHMEAVGLEAEQVPSYTIIQHKPEDAWTFTIHEHEIPLDDKVDIDSVVLLFSGGLDCTVAAAKLKREGYKVHLLHFQYGQRAAKRELEACERIARALDMPLHVVEMGSVTEFLKSPLTGNGDMGTGEHAAESATEWVPARNFLFLAHAVSFADAHDIGCVALGINMEEAGAFPDNEVELLHGLNEVADYMVRPGRSLQFLAPVGNMMKTGIIKLGRKLGAPIDMTWSCYMDGDEPCGECASCTYRMRAEEAANEG